MHQKQDWVVDNVQRILSLHIGMLKTENNFVHSNNVSSSGAWYCANCSSSSYAPNTGSSECTLCPENTYRPIGSSSCIPCPKYDLDIGMFDFNLPIFIYITVGRCTSHKKSSGGNKALILTIALPISIAVLLITIRGLVYIYQKKRKQKKVAGNVHKNEDKNIEIGAKKKGKEEEKEKERGTKDTKKSIKKGVELDERKNNEFAKVDVDIAVASSPSNQGINFNINN